MSLGDERAAGGDRGATRAVRRAASRAAGGVRAAARRHTRAGAADTAARQEVLAVDDSKPLTPKKRPLIIL